MQALSPCRSWRPQTWTAYTRITVIHMSTIGMIISVRSCSWGISRGGALGRLAAAGCFGRAPGQHRYRAEGAHEHPAVLNVSAVF